MSNSNYKHIKLNTSADDDIVIVAGDVQKDGAVQKDEHTASSEVEQPPQVTPTSATSKYTPTTLDDIAQSKMSSTQVIVLAVALISLVAFIIWYIAF